MKDSKEYCYSCIWNKLKKLRKGTVIRVLLKDRDITLILESIKYDCIEGKTVNNLPIYIHCKEIIGFTLLSDIQICGIIPPTSTGCRVLAYVTNNSDNTVSVIDTASNTVTATVPVGSSPFGVDVTPDGSRAYVVNRIGSSVSVIDTATNLVVAFIPVGYLPYEVAISPDGLRAYVTNAGNDNVSVIDTVTNRVISTIRVGAWPIGIGITPNGTRAYVTNFNSNNVSVIDLTSNVVVATIPVGKYPQDVAFTPDGTRAYVVNYGSSNVSVINTSTNTVTATIPVGLVPEEIEITPDGTRAYVINGGDSTVSVIRLSSNTVIATIPVNGNVLTGSAITPDGTRLYVTDVIGNQVFVISTVTNTVVATIPVGTSPIGIAIGTVCEPTAATVWEASTSDFVAGTFEVFNASVTDSITFTVTSFVGSPITVTVLPQSSVTRTVSFPKDLSITSTGNISTGSRWCITLFNRKE
jgi:YVTN family beta-propeller protein